MEIDILRAKSVCEEYCDFVKCDTVCRIDLRVLKSISVSCMREWITLT